MTLTSELMLSSEVKDLIEDHSKSVRYLLNSALHQEHAFILYKHFDKLKYFVV